MGRSTGYKGKDHHPEDVQVHLSNKSRKKITRWERMWMNRRSAIEPVISHLKQDHNMVRNFLKGKEGIVSMLYYPLLGLISLSAFELFFVISKILFLHPFYFQFESCFFSFPQKSQFFRDDYLYLNYLHSFIRFLRKILAKLSHNEIEEMKLGVVSFYNSIPKIVSKIFLMFGLAAACIK
ncbi:hypothetical protein LEP1GSC081_3805 [Leptospira kirschneri str. H1]|uniref:Uncharacterized protein n=1 Tax=Leptospira kirschneri str. H1 TaxID=1049966 RepID=A0A0E2B4U9_9LEPT|nr:hypothetical protein LEP1GSC081_3805 [Leptospira kirschneri str. H1]